MGRIAALDFGLARIGLAISDERRILATPLTKIANDKNVFVSLGNELKKFSAIEEFLVGLPLLLSGKEGDMAAAVRQFAEKLKLHFSIPIIFWDERLTSAQAERALKEAELSRKKRAGLVDSVSALFLLQSYLELKQ